MFSGELSQQGNGPLCRRVQDAIEVQRLVGAVTLRRFVLVDPCSAVRTNNQQGGK